MTIGPDPASGFTALARFGYGARGGGTDLTTAAADPRGYLKSELNDAALAIGADLALSSSRDALQALFEERRQTLAARQQKMEAPSPDPAAQAMQGAAMDGMPAVASEAVQPVPQRVFRNEALARFKRVAKAEAGFVERLVHFWSNHFAVSALKGGTVRATVGSFEREAIRPHALGRFSDMLRAVVGHPAMLAYLDNTRSFGPGSQAGRVRKQGLNENLAREILELHTLGVDGGYTQTDVKALAQMLTGWTFPGPEGRIGEPGVFTFFARGHEPGDRILVGKRYADGGIEQAEAGLADLARHPSTARHIATKFARHFVADEPPAWLTDRLAAVFERSGGDLKALAIALVDSDEAWSASRTKLRSPHEFLMASMRAISHVPDNERLLLGPLLTMGMPLWQPPGPNGWPDISPAWLTPKGMKSRLDVAAAIAARMRDAPHPRTLVDSCLGEMASAETRQAVARAETRQQALALFLMAPEFQWR
ncbi:MAG: DUF1800 family protein [Hyphomicrobiaceae bacterium]